MCGELEEEESPDDIAYARFVGHVQAFLAGSKAKPGGDPLHYHLDRLFRTLLASAADPAKAPEEVGGYDRLAMEPLVFARLAGFIAAHLPLHEDPLKRTIEALMTGYSEGEIELRDHDHEHGHSHDFGHGHTH